MVGTDERMILSSTWVSATLRHRREVRGASERVSLATGRLFCRLPVRRRHAVSSTCHAGDQVGLPEPLPGGDCEHDPLGAERGPHCEALGQRVGRA